MKKVLLALILLTIFACKPGKQKALERVQAAEMKMRSDSTNVLNPVLGKELIESYTDYAKQYPQDSLTPDYLFKAAEVHSGMAQPKEALQLYERVYKEYPNYGKHAYCLFLQGFVYETQIRDNNNAKIKYEEFLKNFPNHPLAKDVAFSLQNLGKSDEELIKEFEQKISDNKASAK